MAAAIAGWPRDSYYDAFRRDNSAISIEVVGEVRTLSQSRHELSTNPDENMRGSGGDGRKRLRVKYPDGTQHRQLRSYEFLVDPAFKIHLATTDEDRYYQLKDKLKTGHTHFPVSMGKSEYLATVEYHGEQTPKSINSDSYLKVSSAVPAEANIVPSSNKIFNERVPGFMTTDRGGRYTTEFVNYAFTKGGSIELTQPPHGCGRVSDRTIVFV